MDVPDSQFFGRPDYSRFRRRGFLSHYLLAGSVWAVLAVITLFAVGRESFISARSEFEHRAETLYADLRDRLRDNEAVLFSFASVLSTIAPDDRDTPRQFAEALTRKYPQVYQLEVVRKVTHGELPSFIAYARRNGYPNFRPTTFGYVENSGFADVLEKDAYYLLVFMHPMSALVKPLIGLDIGSVPFLYRTLQEAENKDRQFASPLFPLAEGGGKAYVMFRMVARPEAGRQASVPGMLGGTTYALLVVQASALQPTATEVDRHTAYLLRHGGYRETAFGDSIFNLPADEAADLETRFLPKLVFSRDFASSSVPFHLRLERQLRFSDLVNFSFVGVFLLALLSLLALLWYLRSHDRQVRRIRAQEEQILHLAMHDQLTGLPNRLLLADRLQQAIDLARRQGEKVGILFLDLDGYKSVNDQFGRAVGDAILKEVGARLQTCVRESDTVGRYGSDEFVLVCSALQHASDAVAIAEKVRQVVGEAHNLADRALALTACIGISVYPDSSGQSDTLLTQADVAMYRAKAQGRNHLQMFRVEGATALN